MIMNPSYRPKGLLIVFIEKSKVGNWKFQRELESINIHWRYGYFLE